MTQRSFVSTFAIVRGAGALLPVLFVATTACTSALGVTELPDGTCGGASSSTDCSYCLNVSCCAQATACGADPACVSIVDCAASCAQTTSGSDFTTCLDGCGSNDPSGVNDYNAYVTCSSTCTSACSNDNGQ
ncbi:MAG TPA: hypothetical protein VGL81_10720 [Polyangiaceae bacterium]|jgi:hypothetical protein